MRLACASLHQDERLVTHKRAFDIPSLPLRYRQDHAGTLASDLLEPVMSASQHALCGWNHLTLQSLGKGPLVREESPLLMPKSTVSHVS